MKQTILIAATARWFLTARLAMALKNAGCSVEAVCPPGHPLSKTSALQRTYRYHPLAPIKSLRNAIAATRPDLIIPGDDLTVQHLHRLYFQEQRKGSGGALVCALIERSLGAPESFPVVFARTAFLELADEEGVRVPKTVVIKGTEDLRKSIAQIGLPMVLKADGSTGGVGVRIVRTFEEAERALRRLQAPPLIARAAKHALFDRDTTLVWPSLLRRKNTVNAQAFVAGREATSAIACWNGAILASLHFEVINKNNSSGPATVLRLIENADMSAAAEKMARRLNLSGLHGFDFMLEARTGNAHLIEMNPRTTQVGHLTLGPGRDLPAALHAALSGEPLQEAPKVTEKTTIALFPQEWLRDPTSVFLKSGYHDVPWEERALLGACIRKRLSRSAWRSLQSWILGFSSEGRDQIESLLETKRLADPPISLR